MSVKLIRRTEGGGTLGHPDSRSSSSVPGETEVLSGWELRREDRNELWVLGIVLCAILQPSWHF